MASKDFHIAETGIHARQQLCWFGNCQQICFRQQLECKVNQCGKIYHGYECSVGQRLMLDLAEGADADDAVAAVTITRLSNHLRTHQQNYTITKNTCGL